MRLSVSIIVVASLLMASSAIAGAPCMDLEKAMAKIAARPGVTMLGLRPQPFTKSTSLLFWVENGQTLAALVAPNEDRTGMCVEIDAILSLGDYSPEMAS